MRVRVLANGTLFVPEQVEIPIIVGDGTGPDIWRASRPVIDAAVKAAYDGQREIEWIEVLAGERARAAGMGSLPVETLRTMSGCLIALKGPLGTPVGEGERSLNVALRQLLDLYACVRPVRYFPGVPSPVKRPEDVDMVIFRENSEDVYSGIEFESDTPHCQNLLNHFEENSPELYSKLPFKRSCGLGIKPISNEGTWRIAKSAIEYALKNRRNSVTIMHKGNIQKYTEGAFRRWAYQCADKEFGAELLNNGPWRIIHRDGHELTVKCEIADSMFQQILLRPKEHDVILTTNLNGDYISDALAAQVGGIGIAPGANINYDTGAAVFEATHGTAPKYAGLDKVNPCSLLLSAVMMLEYMSWQEAANLIVQGIEGAISKRIVTYDFARLMSEDGLYPTEVTCSGFGQAVINSFTA